MNGVHVYALKTSTNRHLVAVRLIVIIQEQIR
jgi:hypothetical protein